MKLSPFSYHSRQANEFYMSASQYCDFAGTAGQRGCEARAMAKLKEEWREESTTSQLVGSYVDAYFEDNLDLFKKEHSECFLKPSPKKPEFILRADFKKAEEIIKRIQRDELFMNFLSGEKQVIITAEMFGVLWKCKIDSFGRGRFITDLKIMADLTEKFWVKDTGKMSWVEYWGYDIQCAVYQKLVEILFGTKLPFFIAAASKQKIIDIEVIWVRQNLIDDALIEIEQNITRIIAVKRGVIESTRCGLCDYCKSTKVLTRPIHLDELLERE